MRKYSHLYPSTMDPCNLTQDAWEAAQHSWLCMGCNYPKPDVDAVDVQLTSVPSRFEVMNLVMGAGVPLVHKSLLSQLGNEQVGKDLLLGKVIDEAGRMDENWITVRGRYRLIVRGSHHVSFRICDSCGRRVYFGAGKRYLYPHPRVDVEFFESDVFGLIVPTEVADSLDKKVRKGVTIEKLPVVDNPVDSLGEI